MTLSVTPVSTFERTQQQFTRHLRAPETIAPPAGVADARMALYRELVYGNMERMLANLFPVLRKVTPDDAWFALVRDFLQRHHCRAGLFTRLPQEFVQYVEQERAAGIDPPFMLELVHYECIDYAATIDPRDIDWSGLDEDACLLDGVPVVNPLAHLLTYGYPVQRISPDFMPAEAPPQPTYLVVCRDRDDKVGFIELNPVSARLLELIAAAGGGSGRALLERIAGELGHPEPEVVVAGGAAILARLKARDVLLGARRASA